MRTLRRIILGVGVFAIGAALCTGGYQVGKHESRPAPASCPPTTAQPETIVTFNHSRKGDDVVEFEYGRCWTVVNARKKSIYQTCSDLGKGK